MAELRHSSSSLGSRSSSSPLRGPAGDEDSTSYSSPHHSDDEEERHPSRDRDRPIWWFHFLLGDDLRAKTSSSKVSIFLVLFLSVASLISVYAIVNHLNAAYLCKKDGIVLNCPHVKESASRWENPLSATTSWKPCAERRVGGVSDILPEN
ncbi:O-fucosyltransferase family protein [Raphanus sativus]|nr:O-fucosyltransferase family protein [Raphanus sativus]